MYTYQIKNFRKIFEAKKRLNLRAIINFKKNYV